MLAVGPRRVAAVLAGIVLLGAACSGGEPVAPPSPAPSSPAPTASPSATATETGPRSGGTLRFALGTDPSAIDPRFLADTEGGIVVDALFDSLVTLDEDLQVAPAAAERWTVNDDATVFVFELRRGATFHDGVTPVTAHDFVRAFDRLADGTAQPPSFVGYLLEPVSGFAESQRTGAPLRGVEALDDHTLRIRLDAPFREFIEVLAHPALGPVPAAADETPERFAEQPIGNGPFEMAEPWRHNEYIRVVRDPDREVRAAYLDEVVFAIHADDPGAEGQYAAFDEGRLHVAEVPIDRLDEAIERYGTSTDGYTGPGVLQGTTTTLYYYGFDVTQPPFDEAVVRQAVSLVIDRERIVEDLTDGTRTPAEGIVPPVFDAHQPDACAFCRYDPARARELLASRGEDAPPIEGPLTIVHNTGRTHQAIADLVASELEELFGVEVAVVSLDLPDLVRRLRDGGAGIFRLGWHAEYPSAESYLRPLFHSSNVGEENLTRFADPEVDRFLDEARAARDPRVPLHHHREVERRVLDQAVIAPMFHYRMRRVVAPDVRGLRVGPLERVDLSEVWLEPEP